LENRGQKRTTFIHFRIDDGKNIINHEGHEEARSFFNFILLHDLRGFRGLNCTASESKKIGRIP